MTRRLIFAAIVSIFIAGCIPKLPGGGEVQNDKAEFIEGKVVGGFPNVPLYPKVKVLESVSNGGSFGASFLSKDSFDKVVKFYSDSLPQLGWGSELKSASDSNFVFAIKNATYEGTIIVNIAEDGKTTAITISVSPR